MRLNCRVINIIIIPLYLFLIPKSMITTALQRTLDFLVHYVYIRRVLKRDRIDPMQSARNIRSSLDRPAQSHFRTNPQTTMPTISELCITNDIQKIRITN